MSEKIASVRLRGYKEINKMRRYVIFLFIVRKDNQGNPRLFRYISEFNGRDQAKAYLSVKDKGGKYLYGVLADTRDWSVLAEFGDAQVEENWVDTPTSTDKYFGITDRTAKRYQ